MFLNMKKLKSFKFFDENFFLYLEEIDLCKRIKEFNQKIFICEDIMVFHYGGKAVDEKYFYEIELTRNWHWMWSLFYYNKKHQGYIYALVLILPKMISALLKFIFYFLFLNNLKSQIYKMRFFYQY